MAEEEAKAPVDSPQGSSSEEKEHKPSIKKSLTKKKDGPAGGYDDTPIPKAPPGWTVKFTFIKATNLPMADINSLSSDPFVLAQLNVALPQRHKEDPALRFRTHTVRRSVDPVWNSEWIVANVPSSGFKLKARVYDEDPADHDDRLGNVHVNVDHIDEHYPGIKEHAYSIKKRMGSKRAYVIRAAATVLRLAHHMSGELYVSVEVLGRTKDENGGRMYTLGPGWWVKHYSPMLGRITGMKEDKDHEHTNGDTGDQKAKRPGSKDKKQQAQRYNFQANQMQLPGPVPAELYHRYVEFKPFVQGMFTHSGIRGFLLNKALHHQHARVYNYDGSTVWGYLPPDDPQAVSKRFLELTHYDKGGRIFTYIITLDGQFRFTETGKEFGIDMLSKHSMHSDVSIYIAFSGEFFIRRYQSRSGRKDNDNAYSAGEGRTASRSPDPNRDVVGGDAKQDEDKEHQQSEGGEVDARTPVAPETAEHGISTDPSKYELIIDNDSGTYRPNAKLLPLFRTFIQRSFPGIHVRVLDCQGDEEKMKKLKDEQREKKKASQDGQTIVFAQRSRASSFASSVSSSDEEELDRLEGGGEGGVKLSKTVKRDAQRRAGQRVKHWKEWDPRKERPTAEGGEEVAGEGPGNQQSGDHKNEEDQLKEKIMERKEADHGEDVVDQEADKQEGHNGEGQGKDEEVPKRHGTKTNQGQAIGRADRDPAEHITKPDETMAPA